MIMTSNSFNKPNHKVEITLTTCHLNKEEGFMDMDELHLEDINNYDKCSKAVEDYCNEHTDGVVRISASVEKRVDDRITMYHVRPIDFDESVSTSVAVTSMLLNAISTITEN